MVPEDDERIVEPPEQLAEPRLAARMRDEVARDADEVGPPLGDPGDGALARPVAARQRRAEVEVGEVRDPEPVERRGQPVDRDLEHARAQPAGLEPAVDRTGENDGSEDDFDREHPGTLEVPRVTEATGAVATATAGAFGDLPRRRRGSARIPRKRNPGSRES